MNWLTKLSRTLAKARFWALGLATIKDIPTSKYEAMIAELVADGWLVASRYEGIDAGIDYGCVTLRKGRVTIKCEWDNWTEGSFEGPGRVIAAIASRASLPVTRTWRWAEYDDR